MHVWCDRFSSCRAMFGMGTRKYELQVSTYQMVVLMLFNQSSSHSYRDIEANTHIPPHDLKRALQSLACAKFKVLNKEPKGRDVNEDDRFIFNEEFQRFSPLLFVGLFSIEEV